MLGEALNSVAHVKSVMFKKNDTFALQIISV